MARSRLKITWAAAVTAGLAGAAWGDLSIRWSTVDGGGAKATGGGYTLSATIGQHDAAPGQTGGGYLSLPGFWPLERAEGCRADINGDGVLNIDDIDEFLIAFPGGDLAADCDGSGTLNIDDVDCFVSTFLAGCP